MIPPLYPEVEVQLSGEDGNAFFIISRVLVALRKAGVPDDVRDEFMKQATAGSYEDVLTTVTGWVTVR